MVQGFRASLSGMLHILGMLRPWIHEGVVDDAIFKVAATFPMNGMAVGVPRQGLPFDVQEFISQVAVSANTTFDYFLLLAAETGWPAMFRRSLNRLLTA
jgi:hypothetical protein